MPELAADQFEKFFKSTSDCQFYVERDGDGCFRYANVNPAALSLAGRTAERELIGLTPVQALGEDYGSTVEQNISAAYSLGNTYNFKGSLSALGTGPVYDAAYIPLKDENGQVTGVLGTARDVSEIALLNDRLLNAKKLEALGEMSGSVAHDFNNILTVFNSALRLLSDPQLDPMKRDFILKEAKRAFEIGSALTQRLNSFAQKEKIVAIPCDIELLISSCEFTMRRVLGAGIKLEVSCDPDLWRVSCAPKEFEISMMNLVANARHAIGNDGEVSVSATNKIRTLSEPDYYPTEYVEITVRDNGCGMSADVVQKAAEPFFSTKTVGEGNGLGLSGVEKFVRDVGGAMRIESEVDLGTSVYILLAREQD